MGTGALAALGGRGIRWWLAVAVLATVVVAMLPTVAGQRARRPMVGWCR